ncbi:MAG: CDP-6-deoxy-delta-3,4-glucoseen reductase [Gallionellales bacterium GWA2_55_18]|nr:MAG: CDP-6-deoxy-delta-3,4-glucoseen reductase [Gallionellales bacterium GWA2_55_18]
MTFSITLHPANHSFPIEASETILDAALKHGYTLPYSCREGSCGVCKGRVLQGSVDHGRVQGSVLSAAEKAAGMVLFCCAMPESDLVIEYREVNSSRDIPVRLLPCRVEKMQRVADDVMVLYLRLPASERLQFLAGQYIDILKGNGKQHSFSLGNAPHDNEFLQLHIRMIPGGVFTQHVFTQMKVRDILRIKGPLGAFYLRDSIKPVIFIASGTGIAPVKAIVEHALHIGIKRPMHLYWGARKLADLYLLDLAKQWEAQGIRFTPVLSEPLAEDHWQGKTGFVHQAVMGDYGDLSGHQVYACGGPVMVNAAHHDFTTRRSLPNEEFFSDSFILDHANPGQV